MALLGVRILVGARIARLPPAAPRSIGNWLRLHDQPHHLAASGAHPETFGTSATAIAIPVRRQSHRTMVDPPDLFLSPQFQTPITDRPRLRANVPLWMRPDIVATLLALLFAIRLYLLQPGLKSRRVPGLEVRRREFRIAAPAIVVRHLRQAADRTFGVRELLGP